MTVVVVGSANVDLVSRVQRIPSPGETVLSRSFAVHPGGKGANQATASARAGATTVFVAAVGDDENGDRMRAGLSADGVDVRARTIDAATGTAVIAVSDDGENAIVVNPGANALLLDLAGEELSAVTAGEVLLVQLEIPVATVTAALEAARSGGAITIVNAAPAASLPARVLDATDVLVVNEHEAALLAETAGAAADLATALLDTVPAVVVTLGKAGALVAVRRDGRASLTPVEGRSVAAVVDTTGAGDTFCGAFAAHLDAGSAGDHPSGTEAREHALVAAARFATAAASLSVQRAGAVPSIPTRAEIDRVL